ncbi:MAG: hypothetical protein EHM58_13770 [Ignavibacteriae bacterium]|nr:MAG: hypothetical protein EHM58_13770 [Ignavibacteriota bacterium]
MRKIFRYFLLIILFSSVYNIYSQEDSTQYILKDTVISYYKIYGRFSIQLKHPQNWHLVFSQVSNSKDNEITRVSVHLIDSLIYNDSITSYYLTAVVSITLGNYLEFEKGFFKNRFLMEDTSLTAFSKDPAPSYYEKISYDFFIIENSTEQEKLNVQTFTKMEAFDKYKTCIEAIVRSIRMVK